MSVGSLHAGRAAIRWTKAKNRPRFVLGREYRQRLRLHALTDAQTNLQLALRQSQDAAEVLQLVREQKQHLNSILASTAIQKLAYLLPTASLRPPDLIYAVVYLATVAASELATMPDPTATLWGFAEINLKCDAVQELVEAFATQSWSQAQQSSHGASSRQTDQWNTVVWAYTDNSDQACKNLVTAAWAIGRLTLHPSPPIVDCMSRIAAELSKKLHNNMLKPAFGPGDLADIVDSFALFLEPRHAGWAQSFSRRSVPQRANKCKHGLFKLHDSWSHAAAIPCLSACPHTYHAKVLHSWCNSNKALGTVANACCASLPLNTKCCLCACHSSLSAAPDSTVRGFCPSVNNCIMTAQQQPVCRSLLSFAMFRAHSCMSRLC